MFLTIAVVRHRCRPRTTEPERGAAVVEWLGISALSIGLLIALFAGMEQVAMAVVESIRGSLGV